MQQLVPKRKIEVGGNKKVYEVNHNNVKRGNVNRRSTTRAEFNKAL